MKIRNTTAALWSLIDTYSGFLISFIFAIAITRILNPQDYGVVAYTGLFLSVANMISEGGFGTALIQKQNATIIDYSTGYYFNVGISVLFFIFYFLSAPYFSIFLNEPAFTNVLRVSSIGLVINSISYIHLIKLIKKVDFKKQTIINLPSSIISGIIGLFIALKGYAYWALVFQTLLFTFIRMTGLLIVVRWRPVLKFNKESFIEQFRFGHKVFLQGLLESFFREIYNFIIGRTYSTIVLGNYSRGKKFYDLFIVQTGIAFNKVIYPLMAKNSNDISNHRIMYFKAYNLFFFFMAPISMFLILMSHTIVFLLLTEKWIEIVQYMQLYFCVGFISLLTYFNSTTIISSNNPTLYLMMDVLQKTLFIIALVFTYNHSVNYIIKGWLIANYIHFILFELIMFRQGYFLFDKYYKMLEVVICLIPLLLLFVLFEKFIENKAILFFTNCLIQPIIYLLTMRIAKFKIYKDFTYVFNPFLPNKLKWLVKYF